ncbi:hypothetical protein PPROV_000730700 [Pycnococcus provasolii]|uniref:Uncharacterized protein n=1 Tax=Pycnococcus provasolii TaxID=41880 RepID=A0A830HS43_9CHLO|nr:hypothetical protein PPROV_000730700 [Pycnococcus provasolii]
MQCINVIQQRIEECKIRYTDGFMLMIYGTSTGSHSIEVKGKRQLTNRGYSKPPIVDVNGNTIAMGEQGAHGPGGESVFDCGSSMVMSKAVETNDEAALAHAPDPGERHRSRGHFHAIVPIKTPWESVPTPKPEAERKVVALDPGVRAFQTCYSTTDGCTGRAISDLGGCIVGCIYDGSPARG